MTRWGNTARFNKAEVGRNRVFFRSSCSDPVGIERVDDDVDDGDDRDASEGSVVDDSGGARVLLPLQAAVAEEAQSEREYRYHHLPSSQAE